MEKPKVAQLKLGRPYKLRLTHVYIFRDGIVISFDEKEHTMHHFTGRFDTVVPKIISRVKKQGGTFTVHISISERLTERIVDTEEFGGVQRFFRELKKKN